MRCLSAEPLLNRLFRNRPALLAWRARLVPTALALFVVQNPLEERASPKARKWTATAASGFIRANDAHRRALPRKSAGCAGREIHP